MPATVERDRKTTTDCPISVAVKRSAHYRAAIGNIEKAALIQPRFCTTLHASSGATLHHQTPLSDAAVILRRGSKSMVTHPTASRIPNPTRRRHRTSGTGKAEIGIIKVNCVMCADVPRLPIAFGRNAVSMFHTAILLAT